jgi:type I restriction enzyme S subunit
LEQDQLKQDQTEMFLPPGWAWTTPSVMCESWGGATPSTNNTGYWGQGIPWVSSKDVKGPFIDTATEQITEVALRETRLRVCPIGSVLVVIRSGVLIHSLPIAVTRVPVVINQDLKAFSPRLTEVGCWIALSLRAQSRMILEVNRKDGTTVQSIRFDELKSITIPLPPLAEQRRIVAKVEEVLARTNVIRQRLAKVTALLKRFRQSILAAACSGRLTSDWRMKREEIEHASELLKRIKHARIGPRGSSSCVMPTNPIEAIESQTELPNSWVNCRANQIAAIGLGGTPSRKIPEYWNGDVPWVSSGEVANCDIHGTTEKITRSGLENSNAKMYPIGTVLIAMIGEGKTRGQSALLNIEACTNQNVAALVFDGGNVVPRYIWFWALGEYEKHRSGGRGGNYPALNGQIVKQFTIPLPPLFEQHEIVRRVEALFALTAKIEAGVASASARAESLIQSTLAKAFRGELVTTEHALAQAEGSEYESAEQLLTRVLEKNVGVIPKKRIATNETSSRSLGIGRTKIPKTNIVKKKHSKGIFFKRAAIAAYAVDRLHSKDTFGRIQLEKLMYLCEAHVGIDLEGDYRRQAAGPLDPDIYKLENLARKYQWFSSRKRARFGIEYSPGTRIADRTSAAKTLLGNKSGEMDRLLGWFEAMNTEQAEVFATVFAAWNDLLIDGTEATEHKIIEQVREHWHEAKERFTPQRLRDCIGWMHKNSFAPRGVGPRTALADSSPAPDTRRKRAA